MLIYPYKPASRGAKALGIALPARRIKHNSKTFIGRPRKIVVNWGATDIPAEVQKCQILNRPEAVAGAANKLTFFNMLSATGLVPEHTERREIAERWIEDGQTVVCRTILNGHSGRGIVLASSLDQIVPAPLYVQYVKKKEEFRVHVVGTEVVDIQRKARRKDTPDEAVNWQVRNHKNGFVFAREGVREWAGIRQLEDVAVRAVRSVGLDFGAVDIIWNEKNDKYLVLEINTAPGIEGSTVPVYAAALELAAEQRIEHEKGITYALSI